MVTGYQVPISACPALRDPPFVFMLFWLATAVGFRLLRIFRVPLGEASALERGVLCAAVGCGFLQYLPFALGMVGRLTVQNILVGIIVFLLVFCPDMSRVARGIFQAAKGIRGKSRPLWMTAGTAILAVVLAGALLKALCPPTDQDAIAYHLTAPKRWLQSGTMGYLPTLTHTQAPMGVEMLYLLAIALWSDTAANLIHFALGVLALLGIFALGRRLRNPAVGFAAASLWFIGQNKESVVNLFTCAYVELGSTTQLVCMVLAWLLWRRSGSKRWLTCAALCAGFALSFKLTALFAGFTLATMVALTLTLQHVKPSVALRTAIGVFVLALLPALPWFLRNWVLTGNPVYPTLSNVFATRDWDGASATAFDVYFKYYNWGSVFGRGMDLVQRMVIRNTAVTLVTILSVVAFCRIRDREIGTLTLAAGMLTTFALLTTGFYARFYIPLFALFCLLVCAPYAHSLAADRRLQVATVTLLFGMMLVHFRNELRDAPTFALVATGRRSRADYLSSRAPNGLYSIWEYANKTLPPDAKVLSTGASYYCDRYCYMTDAYLQRRIRMDTWNHYLLDLRSAKIGYVATLHGVPERHYGPDYVNARNEFPFMRRLADTYGTLMFSAGDFTLYRLEHLPGSP